MFSKRLKSLRLDSNLKQSELANKLKIANSTVSMYEQGRRSPDVDTLRKLALFFNVSIDYLLGKSDVKNPETSDYDKMAEQICELLLEKGIIKQGEEPTEEQRENVLKFLDKAIDLFRI
ncbi:MAG: helix-turn-helix domain-containing protein [Anaerostipes sp.]